ncbi:MAG: hypothetical protein ACM3ZQ_03700 [Bacillota bacterium]
MMTWGLLAVIAFVAGYWLGRREGLRLGEVKGRAVGPLELREQALRDGICPICSETAAATEGENCQAVCSVIE